MVPVRVLVLSSKQVILLNMERDAIFALRELQRQSHGLTLIVKREHDGAHIAVELEDLYLHHMGLAALNA